MSEKNFPCAHLTYVNIYATSFTRLAKLNHQNELKVKKLAEEIQGMKAAKVKLIKQMKEDSEKVRIWKLGKEKEVHQLKQKDRRAQVNCVRKIFIT